MFLRYLDEMEQDKADEAGLQGKKYKYIIDEELDGRLGLCLKPRWKTRYT